ncbi:gag-pol polyprotein, partial [Trifolium medium]|nr:gag-pol polyprotein [Trifolium medium]
LNAIFNGVDKNMFRLINTCTEAKEAWEILQTAHEGTTKVRMSKLQLLRIKFENFKMEENESILEFNARLRD